MNEITKECQGNCAVCGSEDIKYGNGEAEGEGFYYEYTCNKCKSSGKEWYGLKYEETIAINNERERNE